MSCGPQEMSEDAVVTYLAERFQPVRRPYTVCDDDDKVAAARAAYRSPLSRYDASRTSVQIAEADGWARVDVNCFTKQIDGHQVVLIVTAGDPDGRRPKGNLGLSLFGVLDHPTRCDDWY